jgi:hypothetical protein
MRKLFLAAVLITCASSFTFAQTASSDDNNKYDIYVGYSHSRVDFGDGFEGFNGVEGAVKGNISRYVGLKGDYSFARKSFDFGTDTDLHNILGGVEFKDNNKETKVKPFAHVLAGVAIARIHNSAFNESENGFAGAIGGGIDFRVSPRVDIRAIQFDYNPTRLDGEFQHNFRIGVGIIFR